MTFILEVKLTMQIINKILNSVFLEQNQNSTDLKFIWSFPLSEDYIYHFGGCFNMKKINTNYMPSSGHLIHDEDEFVQGWSPDFSEIACSWRHISHPDEQENHAVTAFFCIIVCWLNKTDFRVHSKSWLLSSEYMEYGDIYRRLSVSTLKAEFYAILYIPQRLLWYNLEEISEDKLSINILT